MFFCEKSVFWGGGRGGVERKFEKIYFLRRNGQNVTDSVTAVCYNVSNEMAII